MLACFMKRKQPLALTWETAFPKQQFPKDLILLYIHVEVVKMKLTAQEVNG